MFRRGWKALGSIVIVCGVLLSAAPAEAVPIDGGIRFGGGIGPVANWATVNSIDVTGNQAVVLCNPVVPCSGVFAGLNGGTAVYNDFSFNPLGGMVTPLWSFMGFSFNLTSITSIMRGANGIVLMGTGTMFGPAGFDPTPATWSFSADQTVNTFGFSSTTSSTAVAVPDSGSTLLLLGAGLLALAFVRSRFGF